MSETATFKEASDAQVTYGGWDDPRKTLTLGEVYVVEEKIVYGWTTKVRLVGMEGWFNSVHFSFGPDDG